MDAIHTWLSASAFTCAISAHILVMDMGHGTMGNHGKFLPAKAESLRPAYPRFSSSGAVVPGTFSEHSFSAIASRGFSSGALGERDVTGCYKAP